MGLALIVMAAFGLGFNRSMQHTKHCVSRRSVANGTETSDLLHRKSEGIDVKSISSCALCDVDVANKNDSGEHILLQSLGGRRQVFGFICKICNSRTGQLWDASLNQELAHVALMHGVNRQRSRELPSKKISTVDETQLLLHADGSMSPAEPTFKAIEVDGKLTYSAIARNVAEAKKMIGGLQKKHPKFEATLTTKTEYNNILKMDFSVGGPQSGRSLVKTAVAFAHAMGIPHNDCSNAMHYLRKEQAPPCYGHFHERDLVSGRSSEHLIHCVSVKGDSSKQALLGYVEYFSIAKVVVLLSDKYLGPDVQQIYAIDPSSGHELPVKIDLSLTQDELDRVVHVDESDFAAYRRSLDQAFPVLMGRVWQRSQDQAIHNAIGQAFKELGIESDEELLPNQYWQFSELFVKHLRPYLEATFVIPAL